MLSDGTWTYTWEHGRELATMSNGSTTWTNTYNADGLRTKRTNGSTTYTYVYNGSSLSQMTVGNNTLYFAYDASGTPMSVTYNGTNYYYATNIQGDVTAILNASGTAVVQYTYDAWGKILTTTGSMASTLGVHNPLRYRGYVYDTETGLYYLQSRYYDPELGRFINADAIASTGQGLCGYNVFTYCLNNPVYYQDSLGSKAEKAVDNEENCSLVGAGVQLELDYGLTTAGIEIIVYWDIEQCRDTMLVAVYTYGGCSLDLSDPQLGSMIATITNSQELIMAHPEGALSQIVAILDNSYSASVSGVLIFGNPDFKTVNDYEGAFFSASGSLGHAKAGAAFSESCFAVTIGATSSKKPALGVSLTNYTLRGSFAVMPYTAEEVSVI